MKSRFFSLAGLRRLRVMTWKELLQLFRDTALMVFFLYSFTGDIYIAASGVSMQLAGGGPVSRRHRPGVSPRGATHKSPCAAAALRPRARVRRW